MPRFLISLIVRVLIKERLKNGKNSIFYTKSSVKTTVLMLDSSRYRGDIDILSKSDNLRVLHLRQGVQNFLVNVFLKSDIELSDITNIQRSSKIYNQHIKTLMLFRKVLKKLYSLVSVDCVTTVHFKYLPDYYWTIVSEELSVSYISLHRECNIMSPVTHNLIVRMMEKIGEFHGSHIIVHNEKCRRAFLDANFVSAEKITIGGALRMDEIGGNKLDYVNRFTTDKKKVFTLFYFPLSSSTFCSDKYNIEKYNINNILWERKGKYGCWRFKKDLFVALHTKILEMAVENPDIDFIIKTKSEFMTTNSWKFYERLLSHSNIDFKMLSNYRIEDKVDTHSLISGSNVVCGLQSSSTAESIFMNKKVVIPLFYGLRNTKHYDLFPWINYEDLYCVIEDVQSFEKKVLTACENGTLEYKINHNRKKQLFKECFGFDDRKSLSRYEKTIINTVQNRRNNLER
jgi:hypothetical protein